MITLRGHHLHSLYNYLQVYKNDFSRRNFESDAIQANMASGKSLKTALNSLDVLKKALNPKEKIKLTDTLDDICEQCRFKIRKRCREFIRYDVSAASEDRAVLHFYGLKKRAYTSEYIKKRILKKGTF